MSGDLAPDFSIKDETGKEHQTQRLSRQRGVPELLVHDL